MFKLIDQVKQITLPAVGGTQQSIEGLGRIKMLILLSEEVPPAVMTAF